MRTNIALLPLLLCLAACGSAQHTVQGVTADATPAQGYNPYNYPAGTVSCAMDLGDQLSVSYTLQIVKVGGERTAEATVTDGAKSYVGGDYWQEATPEVINSDSGSIVVDDTSQPSDHSRNWSMGVWLPTLRFAISQGGTEGGWTQNADCTFKASGG